MDEWMTWPTSIWIILVGWFARLPLIPITQPVSIRNTHWAISILREGGGEEGRERELGSEERGKEERVGCRGDGWIEECECCRQEVEGWVGVSYTHTLNSHIKSWERERERERGREREKERKNEREKKIIDKKVKVSIKLRTGRKDVD